MKKQIIMTLVSLMLVFNNSFAAGNAQFKAMFVDDGAGNKPVELTDNKIIPVTETFSPRLIDISGNSDDFMLRTVSSETACLVDDNGVENCPNSMVQCNQETNKSKGLSVKHEKTITVSKMKKGEEFVCPEDFIPIDGLDSENSLCKKDYVYYTYECPTKKNQYDFEWNGPLVQTGADCLGQCGPSGCVCNEEEPPAGNCIQEDLKCPFDENKACTQMKADTDTREAGLPFVVYSLGESSKIDKVAKKAPTCLPKSKFNPYTELCEAKAEVYDIETREAICEPGSSFVNGTCIHEPVCPSDYKLSNGTCEKEYSYFSYSCEEGAKVKDNGSDCKGTCTGYSCQCNPETSPENNCSIERTTAMSNDAFSYTKTVNLKQIEASGSFNVEFENEFFKKEVPITTIKGKKGELCFDTGAKSSCVEVKGCSFMGEDSLDGKLSLDVTSKKIGNIFSSCLVNGSLGNGIDAITSVEAKGNKLIFTNNFKEVNLGELSFISKDVMNNNQIATDLLMKGFHSFSSDGNSYFASEVIMSTPECKEFAAANNSVIEMVFKSKELKEKAKMITQNQHERVFSSSGAKCIIKYNGLADFSKVSKTEITKKDKGFTTYGCSPFKCTDGSCKEAVCPIGYDGPIQPKGYYPLDGECQDQVCDGNKDYSPYCGKTQECDVSNPAVIVQNGECKQMTCDKGEFNPSTKQCEIQTSNK